MTIQTLPLSSLTLSALNVRRTARDADIEALAEDIAASGLKQNLVVVPAHFSTAETEENFGERFEVVAGGRRLMALRLLAEADRIPADHPIPVLVEERGEARQTSLSENLHRVAMNPADEFEAFATIVERFEKEGLLNSDAIAATAKRFGVSARHVQQRLRLAALAPPILEALRSGEIGVETAKAYASTPDQDRQLAHWEEYEKRREQWRLEPRGIRNAMARDTLPLDHPYLSFVELDAYLAAGGRLEADLFMGAEIGERIGDVPLLERLVTERGEAMVAAQAKADGFGEGRFLLGIGHQPWPAPIEGYDRIFRDLDKLPAKTARRKCIAIYAVADAGDGLRLITYFKPAVPAEEQGAEDGDNGPRGADGLTWEQRRAKAREAEEAWEINYRAAKLVLGDFTGTPFEGRAHWPDSEHDWVEAFSDDEEDDFVLIAVQVRIPRCDLTAHADEARQLLEAEERGDEPAPAEEAAEVEEPAE